MLNAYVMVGINGEYLMVLRGDDEGALLAIAKQLQDMRGGEVRHIGRHLEKELENAISRRSTGKNAKGSKGRGHHG